jgi:hypothetical protein
MFGSLDSYKNRYVGTVDDTEDPRVAALYTGHAVRATPLFARSSAKRRAHNKPPSRRGGLALRARLIQRPG